MRFKRQPGFNHFRRTNNITEPRPVPIGDIFADFETVGNYLKEPVYDNYSLSSDPQHRINWQIFWSGLRFFDQTIRFCIGNGWDYAF